MHNLKFFNVHINEYRFIICLLTQTKYNTMVQLMKFKFPITSVQFTNPDDEHYVVRCGKPRKF